MAAPEVHAPVLGAPGEPCTTCGSPLAGDQRYCLNCGDRRAGVPSALDELLDAGAAAAPPVEPPASALTSSGDGRRNLPLTWMTAAGAAGALVVAVLLGAIVGNLTGKAPEVNVPAAKAPVVNVTGGGAAPAAATEAGAAEFVSDWSGEGWTVQLQTLPKDGTDPAAIDAAKTDATGRGATDVGALDSDEFPSLDPGTYVIYSGNFATKKEATAALKDLKADFPDAKVVEVTTSTDAEDAGSSDTDADGTAKADTEDLKELNNASGDEFVDKSKKLKDETAIEGEPPPTDDKKPGGDTGGDAETIE
ncbi:MAG: SPOR domain-containing protein [Solirubrobacteraceae bacterium]